MIESRRLTLIESLREQLLQHLVDRFKGLSGEETIDLLEELENRVSSEEFNKRLFDMKLDATLIGLLEDSKIGIDGKMTVANILCELARYSELEHVSLVQPRVVELLARESLSYSFRERTERRYIITLLSLISLLSSLETNPELYDYLTSSNFCEKIARKLCE